VLVATRLPLEDWAPVKRKPPPAESLFGLPVPQSGLADGLPADFDYTSYRCSVTPRLRRLGRLLNKPMPHPATIFRTRGERSRPANARSRIAVVSASVAWPC